mmetsp:Transcript_42313/g.42876  ORF Transcript_42313/g.42876 Transcript_42313/m.42876 type:complete len:258 (+) Transcript_42313:516-1289(+)
MKAGVGTSLIGKAMVFIGRAGHTHTSITKVMALKVPGNAHSPLVVTGSATTTTSVVTPHHIPIVRGQHTTTHAAHALIGSAVDISIGIVATKAFNVVLILVAPSPLFVRTMMRRTTLLGWCLLLLSLLLIMLKATQVHGRIQIIPTKATVHDFVFLLLMLLGVTGNPVVVILHLGSAVLSAVKGSPRIEPLVGTVRGDLKALHLRHRRQHKDIHNLNNIVTSDNEIQSRRTILLSVIPSLSSLLPLLSLSLPFFWVL